MRILWNLYYWLLSFCTPKSTPQSIITEIEIPGTSKNKLRAPESIGLIPLPGNEFNPFRKYPRNEICYCGSGIKYKRCCSNSEPLAIKKEIAKEARILVNRIRGKA